MLNTSEKEQTHYFIIAETYQRGRDHKREGQRKNLQNCYASLQSGLDKNTVITFRAGLSDL